MMVSFIVIGRNEAAHLKKCLQSVVDTIQQNQLHAELLYVDSQSTDESVAIANAFELCRVYGITGQCNAAIARNIGAKEAQGESLFFIDGDMELQVSFIPKVLNNDGSLKHPFVSGNFINHYYDSENNFIAEDYYRKIFCNEDTLQPTTGGLFAIKRELWESVGGMRPKFKRGQDLDLGYRLAQKGYLLLRKKETMAIHHTIDYKFSKRLWSDLLSGTGLYSRSVLYRCHLSNKYVLKRMLSSDPTMLVLVFLLLTTFIFLSLWPLFIYPFIVLIAVGYSMRKKLSLMLFERWLVQILRDVQVLGGLFLFYPSNQVEYQYEQV